MEDTFVKPEVELVGQDGNAFAIIGRVSKALRKAGSPEKAKEFQNKALRSSDYDALLQLCMDYCEPV